LALQGKTISIIVLYVGKTVADELAAEGSGRNAPFSAFHRKKEGRKKEEKVLMLLMLPMY
jgi:hypothetical protein